MQKRPILVIDDDPQFRELITAMLMQGHFEVLSAPDGPSGIELARRAKPAVIVLDMMMPGMDGIETLQGLKQDPVLTGIPVVGVTASSDVTVAGKAFRGKAQFFLPKPIRAANLFHVMELAVQAAPRKTRMHRSRRHPRHRAELPVRCFVRGVAEATRNVAGHTANISLDGLLLLLSEALAPGTTVRLGLGLPEGPITARGQVMWRHPQPMGDGKFPHGIQLVGSGADSGLVGYRRYVSQISGARA